MNGKEHFHFIWSKSEGEAKKKRRAQDFYKKKG